MLMMLPKFTLRRAIMPLAIPAGHITIVLRDTTFRKRPTLRFKGRACTALLVLMTADLKQQRIGVAFALPDLGEIPIFISQLDHLATPCLKSSLHIVEVPALSRASPVVSITAAL
jgi:hypothetical protein